MLAESAVDWLVDYQCPQPVASPLYRGVLTAELVVTAGPSCCKGEGKAVATVTRKPTVTVLPPTSPVVICEDLQEAYADVAFTVQANAPGDITVPNTIAPTGSAAQGNCIVPGSTNTRKCER
jgi:hypothetical protein